MSAKKATCIFLLLQSLLISNAGLRALGGLSYSLATRLDLGFGNAAYDLKVDDSVPFVHSRLDFPLDGIYPSLQFTLDYSADGSAADWKGIAELKFNISAPQGLFIDQDWWEFPGTPRILWSYTESGTSLQYFLARLELNRFWTRISEDRLSVYYHGGFSFERMYWTANNINGWQYVWNTGTSSYDLYSVKYYDKALTYELFYYTPYLGLLLSDRILPELVLNLSADFLLPIMLDRDDHLLRNKLSTAAGLGVGYKLAGSLKWNFRKTRNRPAWSLGLDASVRGSYVNSKQRQEWYGPDGATPAGTVFTDIGHVVSLFQPAVGFSVGAGW